MLKIVRLLLPGLFLVMILFLAAFERSIGLPWVLWWALLSFFSTLAPERWLQWVLVIVFGWWLAALYLVPVWLGVGLLVVLWWVATVGLRRFTHPTTWLLVQGMVSSVALVYATHLQFSLSVVVVGVCQIVLVIVLSKAVPIVLAGK